MKFLTIATAVTLMLSAGTAFAQSQSGSNVRAKAGHFCAENKCVRFSRDLRSVSIQGRQAVSVASYRLRSNPVISAGEYRQIFKLALIQRGANGSR